MKYHQLVQSFYEKYNSQNEQRLGQIMFNDTPFNDFLASIIWTEKDPFYDDSRCGIFLHELFLFYKKRGYEL